ncbi:glycosyltransferase family 2 protein [Rubrivirga sp. IMCC45206]|uniref:glycosyltransferase family 2 protein n=1 Tax=Rubrivirga sp. IMCC45206 TaxID=3391614 RepID=UPI00398F97E6
MSTDAPRVALAVPVYNGEAFLPALLDALRAQTEARWTAVITDNASTDGTAEIARAASATDPRFRYARNETNLGANGNFNRSMAHALATGAPFVKWAACDDRLRPGFLAACLGALDARPEAAGAHTGVVLVDEADRPYPFDAERGGFLDGDDVFRWTPDDWAALGSQDPGERLFRFLHDKTGQSLIYGVFRRHAVAHAEPFAMPGVEDAVCAELVLAGPLAFVDRPLFEQRLHPGSARRMSRRDYIEYETGVRPTGLLLPSGGRAVAFARGIARARLSLADRARAAVGLARFAVGLGRLKNLVVPGPDNYFGLGAERA